MFINLAKVSLKKKGQVSIEYMLIFAFVTFVVLIILGVAFFYSSSIKDSIKVSQADNYANKIVSSSESVFYSGEPSKATISAYLPDSVENVDIQENHIYIELRTSSGLNKMAFPSKVPISGSLSNVKGVKNIEITANDTAVTISEK
jgi:uncharacterized protein (UPF0333 family)